MPRLVRPLLLLLAVILMLVAGRSDGREIAPGSRPELQTTAPTGTVVVKLTTDATDADRQRLANLAAAPAVPRLDTELLARAAAKSRRAPAALADLARYIQFDGSAANGDQLVRLARRLAADPAVEVAFLEPRAVPAALGFDAFTGAIPTRAPGPLTPLPTPDFTGLQGYLGDAPEGVGAWSVWPIPGARGGTVKIVDVEGAWLWDHEDLPDPFLDLGTHVDDLGWRNHGTAVMGEMRGHDNEYGMDGIVPDCQVGASSIADQSFPEALLNAALHLDMGDLLLIELHAPGPNANGDGQFGYLPMEFWQDNFDAIRALTDLGIIVVEAAGNGQQNLDDPVYLDLFDRQVRDSGAIMVGATSSSSINPAWFTNHGQRVDLAGWGSQVATTGYGGLQGGDETEWYTETFSGTSSASPIVTGSVASLQGMVEAANGFSLDAGLAREILRQTGTPTSGPQLIGPRPDLVSAWDLASLGVSMLTGTVTEAGSGMPVAGATVAIAPEGPRITTAADGTYRLGLLPGDYTVTVESYFHEFHSDVVTVASGLNSYDTALTPLPLETITGTVFDAADATLAGARLELIDAPIAPAYSDQNGLFAFDPVPEGQPHRLLAGGVPGHGGRYFEFPVTPAPTDLVVVLPTTDYDFEDGDQGFVPAHSLWQRGRPADTGMGPGTAFDGDWCWGVGLDGAGYPDDAFAELSSPLYQADDFDGDRLYLSFHYWSGTESGFDGVQVLIYPSEEPNVLIPVNGYTDLTLSGLDNQPGWSGYSDGWRTAVFDVSDWLDIDGWTFLLRFGSDGFVTYEGFLVDGITIEAVDTAVAVLDQQAPAAAAPVLAAWPNPFNPRVDLAWELAAPTSIDLEIYDLRGRLVRRLLQGLPVSERGHVTWNGTDQTGRTLPSGVYLVKVQEESGAATTRRITLAR